MVIDNKQANNASSNIFMAIEWLDIAIEENSPFIFNKVYSYLESVKSNLINVNKGSLDLSKTQITLDGSPIGWLKTIDYIREKNIFMKSLDNLSNLTNNNDGLTVNNRDKELNALESGLLKLINVGRLEQKRRIKKLKQNYGHLKELKNQIIETYGYQGQLEKTNDFKRLKQYKYKNALKQIMSLEGLNQKDTVSLEKLLGINPEDIAKKYMAKLEDFSLEVLAKKGYADSDKKGYAISTDEFFEKSGLTRDELNLVLRLTNTPKRTEENSHLDQLISDYHMTDEKSGNFTYKVDEILDIYNLTEFEMRSLLKKNKVKSRKELKALSYSEALNISNDLYNGGLSVEKLGEKYKRSKNTINKAIKFIENRERIFEELKGYTPKHALLKVNSFANKYDISRTLAREVVENFNFEQRAYRNLEENLASEELSQPMYDNTNNEISSGNYKSEGNIIFPERFEKPAA